MILTFQIEYSMHLEELQDKDMRCRRNETFLWKLHGETFTQWVKEKVYDPKYTILYFIYIILYFI